QPAVAHMLYGLDDIRMRRVFINDEGAGDDRKRREHKRLDALIGYCESPACRRGVLLEYFGEATQACGNCDVCLDPVEMADGTTLGQMVLSAVTRTGGRYGAVHIVDVLRGTVTEKVARAGHDRLQTFGIGADRGRQDWRSLIRQLVAAGFLRLDVAGYGGLSMTEKGAALLRGEEAFGYRPDRLPGAGRKTRERKARKARGPAAADAEAPPLTPDQASLLAALRELRLGLARDRRVPAYVVFTDRALDDMARRAPGNEGEFAEVHGVGAAKLRDFAAPFLAAIAAHEQII
ncbi:MAG: RQC domain-containing protein, partial [Alphaproteobacteria bacterium]